MGDPSGIEDLTVDGIKQKLLSQLPFEQIETLVKTKNPQEVIMMIKDGIMPEIALSDPNNPTPEDEEAGLKIATKVYEAMMDFVAEKTNTVITDLNPEIKKLTEGAGGMPGQPPGMGVPPTGASPIGAPPMGPQQGNVPAGPGVMRGGV